VSDDVAAVETDERDVGDRREDAADVEQGGPALTGP
jgi:hypothetical protein